VDVRCRIPFLVVLTLCAAVTPLSAQAYEPPKARKHFVSVSFDSLHTETLHFAEHPLSDLLGRDVASTQGQEYEYRTRDEATLIDVIVRDRDPAEEEVPTVIFPAKDAETAS